MPPKKKKKDKKDPNKLTQVDRTFYELTITDLNQKLARLRGHMTNLDETNVAITDKLHELELDRTDVAAHLERTLHDRNNTIVELEERLVEVSKVREEEKRMSSERILELENKYKAMHDQLTSEMKLLNGKLNSLDEFRIQRDVILARFDDQEAAMKEKESKYQDEYYRLEQRAVVEKDALKKEVESKLLQVSEDFMRSSEIRNAGYTRRLIRENIALQKEIDKLIMSQIKLQQQFQNQKQKHAEILQQYIILDHIKTELVRNSVNKIKIIKTLTRNYEDLKGKYVESMRFRREYEVSIQREQCERAKHKDVAEKITSMSKRIHTLTVENNNATILNGQQELEILRLQNIIEKIQATVTNAIKAVKSVKLANARVEEVEKTDTDALAEAIEGRENAITMCQLKRADLLTELMEIICAHEESSKHSRDTLPTITSSVYEPGKMGFMQTTFDRVGLIEAFNEAITAPVIEEVELAKSDGSIAQRSVIEKNIFDVELGSTLYVSSSRDEDADIEVEEEPLEEPEGSSSSVSIQKRPSSEPQVVIASVEPTQLAKSEIDEKSVRISTSATVPAEAEELGEEEDFDINLFY